MKECAAHLMAVTTCHNLSDIFCSSPDASHPLPQPSMIWSAAHLMPVTTHHLSQPSLTWCAGHLLCGISCKVNTGSPRALLITT